ncbi:MAG: ester cyclase [Longimicrobiales bacterium]|nr:ester cyclase [Longimicrobiales bacterium]
MRSIAWFVRACAPSSFYLDSVPSGCWIPIYPQHLDAVIAAWNGGNVNRLDAYLSADIARKALPALDADANSLSERKEVTAGFREAHPDAHVAIGDFRQAGDISIAKWTLAGTNTGPGDMSSTGKGVWVEGVSINRYVAGKSTDENQTFDALRLMAPLGHIELSDG